MVADKIVERHPAEETDALAVGPVGVGEPEAMGLFTNPHLGEIADGEEASRELVLPELADITYEATRVKHGDMIRMGGVGLEVVHVPGHRPEQINLLVYDFPRGDEPWFILTADFVMVGDVARPDLAQKGEEGAPVLFDVAIPRFLDLPDHVEVYPGHLAGST